MENRKTEEFVTFMFQMVAYADFETMPKEIAMVKDKASSLISKQKFTSSTALFLENCQHAFRLKYKSQ